MDSITHQYLIDILEYNPETGIFIWKVTGSGTNKVSGTRAGSIHSTGYRYIELNSKAYAEHRLAWFYCFKEWPTQQLDHINRDRSDNSLDNLREVSNRENSRNRACTSKYGSNIYKNKNKFLVQFKINNIANRFGTYPLEEAVLVRDRVMYYIDNNIDIPSAKSIREDLNIQYNGDKYVNG